YRVAFIDVIGEVGNVKSVVKLAPMASHYNPDVRAAAFRALSRIGGPAAENKMIEELGKGSADAKFVEARIRDFGTFRNKG
ncbi:MAG: HEAT repeat domain-containing protein, partial [Deltaproteobacteria bacterium]|nr:HEAT repeat domain-containing protein [Deltaproteobacteria bacterium]